MALARFSFFKKITAAVSFFLIAFALSASHIAFAKTEPLISWLANERGVAETRMFDNISPPGAAQGAVAASPSRKNPDYYYHWVRDAAITANEIVFRQEEMETPEERQKELRMLENYAAFSRSNQLSKSLTGLGEPKFNMDGSPFNGPWARPQNDSPALRAITLIHWARVLESSGRKKEARDLISLQSPKQSVIGADLNYIAANWKKPCYDLWEETFGQHFFTRMVERKALLDGANFLESLGDASLARSYRTQAQALSRKIEKHWNSKKKIIVATLNQTNKRYKKSGLDSSVILGVLMGNTGDGFFAPEDDRVLATVKAQEDSFKALYPINHLKNAPGIAIGRYPEDRYNGTDVFKPNNGNPWVLNTEAFSEFYSVLISDYKKIGEIRITKNSLRFFKGLPLSAPVHFKSGERIASSSPLFGKVLSALAKMRDRYMNTVRFYAYKNGTLSEQIDRKTGAMTSAPNLTWNYAAFLSQDRARH